MNLECKKVLIHQSGIYDILNEIYWSEDLLRRVAPLVDESITKREGRTGRYYFDEIDQCVYYDNHT